MGQLICHCALLFYRCRLHTSLERRVVLCRKLRRTPTLKTRKRKLRGFPDILKSPANKQVPEEEPKSACLATGVAGAPGTPSFLGKIHSLWAGIIETLGLGHRKLCKDQGCNIETWPRWTRAEGA